METENSFMEDVVVEVKNLSSHYDSRKILDDINMVVHQGEIMVIMGGSGSGKSTLLRNILALNNPTSGTIRLFGKDITNSNRQIVHDIRKKIGVAFQGGALFGSMTVGENVRLPLREHTSLDEKTILIMSRMKLEVVNLSGFDDFMPAELSGGMIKRAALARAVVMDPQLLFFDEPSAGLDPVSAAELDELILKLRDAMNITIVVVTHELDSAFKIADRITILDKGKIIGCGTPEEIRNDDDQRIQNLINRQVSAQALDQDDYLRRLTR